MIHIKLFSDFWADLVIWLSHLNLVLHSHLASTLVSILLFPLSLSYFLCNSHTVSLYTLYNKTYSKTNSHSVVLKKS